MTKKSEATKDEVKGVAVKAIPEAEYQRRIKLVVSNVEYINPSYDR